MKDTAGLAAIMGNLRKQRGPPMPAAEPDDDEGASGDGDLETAAGEILAAIENKDARALAGALSSFFDMKQG